MEIHLFCFDLIFLVKRGMAGSLAVVAPLVFIGFFYAYVWNMWVFLFFNLRAAEQRGKTITHLRIRWERPVPHFSISAEVKLKFEDKFLILKLPRSFAIFLLFRNGFVSWGGTRKSRKYVLGTLVFFCFKMRFARGEHLEDRGTPITGHGRRRRDFLCSHPIPKSLLPVLLEYSNRLFVSKGAEIFRSFAKLRWLGPFSTQEEQVVVWPTEPANIGR